MKEGDVVLTPLPQADAIIKNRPASPERSRTVRAAFAAARRLSPPYALCFSRRDLFVPCRETVNHE